MQAICDIGGIKHAIDTEDKTKRRISLKPDFMKYNKNDIMYGYLLFLASYNEEENLVYLLKSTFANKMEDIQAVTGYHSIKSIYNNLEKWKKTGLVYDGYVEEKSALILKITKTRLVIN